MGKFDNAYFEFEIEPEESNFLKSWNELRNDEGFQKKLFELKRHLQKNEMSLSIDYDLNDKQTKLFNPLLESDWQKIVYKIPNKSYEIETHQNNISGEYVKLDKRFTNRFQETVQTASYVLNGFYESGIFSKNNDMSAVNVI